MAGGEAFWHPLSSGGASEVDVKKSGTLVGARGGINFVEGTNITLTVTDDSANDEVDVTIAASSSGAGTHSGVAVYNSANQSIPNATWTTLAFNNEKFDDATFHDTAANNSRLTAQTTGRHHIAGSIRFAANTTGTRGARVLKNGTTVLLIVQDPPNVAGVPKMVSVYVSEDLTAGDYLELQAFQASGGALNVESGVDTMFEMHEG